MFFCLVSLENDTIRLLAQTVCQTRVSPCQQHGKAVIVPFVFSVITDDGKRSHPALLNGFRPHTAEGNQKDDTGEIMRVSNAQKAKCRGTCKRSNVPKTGREKDGVLPGTTFLIFIPCIGTPLGSAKAPRI